MYELGYPAGFLTLWGILETHLILNRSTFRKTAKVRVPSLADVFWPDIILHVRKNPLVNISTFWNLLTTEGENNWGVRAVPVGDVLTTSAGLHLSLFTLKKKALAAKYRKKALCTAVVHLLYVDFGLCSFKTWFVLLRWVPTFAAACL